MSKKFYILISFSLFSNYIFTKIVVISQREILEKTAQGQSTLQDIHKFERNMIAQLDIEKEKVVASEQELDKLSQELESEKNKISQNVYQKKSQALARASQGLLVLQQQFYDSARRVKEIIDHHFEFVAKRFFRNLLEKYAPSYGWDVVLSLESNFIGYQRPMIDGTQKLLSVLKKQSEIQSRKYSSATEIKKLFEDLGLVYLENNKKDANVKKLESIYAPEVYAQDVEMYQHRANMYSKAIEAQQRASMYVAWVSDNVGWGVFAQKDIREGEFIQEYVGVIERVDKDFDATYAWDLCPFATKDILAVDSRLAGNEMRFVNHSNHPNILSLVIITKDNTFHVCYVANAFIKAGEQLLVSYGNSYWVSRNYYEQI